MALKRFVLLFALAACIAAIAVSGAAIWQLAERGGRSAGRAAIGGPFQLVDSTGRQVSEADFRGRPMLIYFGYTYCPDVCPTELQAMSAALDRLGSIAEQIQPLFITIDPERDTPEQLASYCRHFHPRLACLTGTAEQVAGAAKSYRVFYARTRSQNRDAPADNYLLDHSSYVYLMAADGLYLTHFGPGTDPEAMAERIRAYL
ncbi:MAG: SCO family protein [Alphaproteobacteria bacterium]|nr:SCO family protein [Alphaproteobacteria bacterium]